MRRPPAPTGPLGLERHIQTAQVAHHRDVGTQRTVQVSTAAELGCVACFGLVKNGLTREYDQVSLV